MGNRGRLFSVYCSRAGEEESSCAAVGCHVEDSFGGGYIARKDRRRVLSGGSEIRLRGCVDDQREPAIRRVERRCIAGAQRRCLIAGEVRQSPGKSNRISGQNERPN